MNRIERFGLKVLLIWLNIRGPECRSRKLASVMRTFELGPRYTLGPQVGAAFRDQPPQTTVPTIAPIPAVIAIARAPQKVTRNIGFKISAPPVLAPRNPSKARNRSDPVETMGISRFDGESRTSARGAAAPTENVAADVSAAWIGLAVVISEIPSSSRACAPNASLAIS